MNSFEYVSAKLGNVKPETKLIARELYDVTKAAGHEIWYMWGYDGNVNNTEHHSGLALDLMVRNEAAGDWLRDYIWANRERLRLRHVIWEQHITSTVTQPGVRRKMADRGSVTENHYDHNHALFFPGTYRPPTGSPAQPGGSKTVAQLATEVIAGKWGNGDERKARLKAAGYNYDTVQAEVRRRLLAPTSKSIGQLATEVIQGKWGNGDDRVRRLKAAGYDPKTVQAEVNRRLL